MELYVEHHGGRVLLRSGSWGIVAVGCSCDAMHGTLWTPPTVTAQPRAQLCRGTTTACVCHPRRGCLSVSSPLVAALGMPESLTPQDTKSQRSAACHRGDVPCSHRARRSWGAFRQGIRCPCPQQSHALLSGSFGSL